jgi:hypothetical protein
MCPSGRMTRRVISPIPNCSTAVRQTVHDLNGQLLLDKVVSHIFRIDGGLVRRFYIRNH